MRKISAQLIAGRISVKLLPRQVYGYPVLFVVAAVVLSMVPLLVNASDGPRDWLKRMDHAVEYLNYEGTLVHMHAGRSDTYQIYHRVEDGVVTERLVALDGAGREIIRDQDEVTCIFPDQQSVVVEKRRERDSGQSPLQASLPAYSQSGERYYQFSMVRSERVAGRAARLVAIRPKDNYRYGYRLWLDEATAMPLKSQLRSEETGNYVEEILFANISLPERVSADRVRSSLVTDKFSWLRAENSAPSARQESVDAHWRAMELPPGFMLAAAKVELLTDAASPRHHIVYTDGLATVSVFIDVTVAASEQAEGVSKIGTANAYSTMHDGWLVTAVGQVPLRTVQMISLSVRSVPGESSD